MKKLFALILALLMLCACGSEEIPEQPEINEPGSNGLSEPVSSESKKQNLEPQKVAHCVYETADGKYIIMSGGEKVINAEYDVYERIALGGKYFYALGIEEGIMPALVFNEEYGFYDSIGETKRILYDIFSSEGEMLLSYPAESFQVFDEKLYVTLEGNLFGYEFSENGEIVNEITSPKGKTGNIICGLEETIYNWDYWNDKKGLENPEGKTVLENIYLDIEEISPDRILAYLGQSFTSEGEIRCIIFDLEGNIICEKYNSVLQYVLEDGSKIIIGSCSGENAYAKCYDENGNVHEAGDWFIDKDGNKISEKYEYIDFISLNGKTITAETEIKVTFFDGTETTVLAGEYILNH